MPTDDLTQRTRYAQAVVLMRGSAQPTDVKLVIAELVKFELAVLKLLQKSGAHVDVCRNAVTNYLTNLAGAAVPGAPAGTTWDAVTGTYWAPTTEVVIAVVGAGTPAGAHTPLAGEGTTSENVTLRESMRAIDRKRPSGISGSSDPAFVAARDADLATLAGAEAQPGPAGVEETWAESAARFYNGNPNDAALHPHLHAYWAAHPLPLT